jgi:hypothetical protein
VLTPAPFLAFTRYRDSLEVEQVETLAELAEHCGTITLPGEMVLNSPLQLFSETVFEEHSPIRSMISEFVLLGAGLSGLFEVLKTAITSHSSCVESLGISSIVSESLEFNLTLVHFTSSEFTLVK